uniref:Uncharacterized protein n=1 Tax=Corethron hystrix TaxID=216773 RepID=A0A7S1B6P6_9STRA|mmetsp:Transcript_14479/g.31829  ORF Transcript_14479/g.31829 Transcript_14479/m.31829 type:complete len:115 (+) Transcript_14479:50-394(+)
MVISFFQQILLSSKVSYTNLIYHSQVSFMDHDNPKNRSFHCVFTNSCKNAFGGEHILAVGSVTAPLLEQMIYRTLIKKQSNDTKASNSSHENYAGAVGNIMGEQRFPQSLVGEA